MIRTVLVTLLPGVDRNHALEQLRERGVQVTNLRGGGARDVGDRLFGYLEWAGTTARVLSHVLSRADVDRLVLSRRYELLVSSAAGLMSLAGNNLPTRVLNDLVSIELEERVAAFDAAVTALRDQITRWDRNTRYVVLDTCVYLEHRDQFDTLNLAATLHALETPIRVLLPMVVLDELDAAKRLHDHRRGRAVLALAIIDKIVRANGVLRERDQAAVAAGGPVPVPGRVTLDVLSEPPDHVRLHHPDAEIVDRAVAIQAIAGVPVTLVTFDTTIAFRAREAGLIDVKLDEADRFQGHQKTKKQNAPAAQ